MSETAEYKLEKFISSGEPSVSKRLQPVVPALSVL